MAYVKFVKGTVAQYTTGIENYSTNGSVFFATDDSVIYANGVAYGISAAEKAKLAASVKTVEILPAASGDASLKLKITYTNDTTANVEIPAVTATRNGLMTPNQKSNLETVYGEVVTGGAGTLKNQVLENKVSSSDGSIAVTAGSTSGSTVTGTDISVNVDGVTIVKNQITGALQVAAGGLTPYVGDNKAIEVTTGQSENTISLKIKSGDKILSSSTVSNAADGLSATLDLHRLNSTELTALGDDNVKEAYQLQGIGGTVIGDTVKIYKDSALQEVYLGASTDTINATTGVITKNTVTDPQSLNFAYQLADGTYSLTKIDVSKFLTQSEFGDGLAVSGAGVVSVKVAQDSESFLTVTSGANGGVKLSGVGTAISDAAAEAKTELQTVSADGTIPSTGAPKIVVTKDSTAADGHDKYTVSGQDLASATLLTKEVTDRGNADTAIKNVIGNISDGANNSLVYTPENGATYGTDADTIQDRLAAFDSAISTVAGAAGAALTNISVNGVSGTVNNNVASTTIDAADIQLDDTKTSSNHALLNTGGFIYDDATIKAAIAALEAKVLWYEANDTVPSQG